MLTRKIEEIVRSERVIHQDDVVHKLSRLGEKFNIETVFRTLRKLATDGKVASVGGGWYKKESEDKTSEKITKWC